MLSPKRGRVVLGKSPPPCYRVAYLACGNLLADALPTSKRMPDLNEGMTRALLINPQLERAGWNLSDHSKMRLEVPVQGYDPTPWNGFTDFCLYDVDGSVLAVIEAKKTARNAREGEEQLRQYVAEIAAKQDIPPFGFMTNGLHHHFWEVGLSHPRLVAGFFSAD